MKICEIYKLKRLAGIIDKDGNKVEKSDGSNISIVGSDKGRIQRERGIKPGTDEWFRLWFARPHLTGEKPTKDQNMQFDLVSDLHMEHWENNYNFLQYKQSQTLVVAGDVASDPDLTAEWLTIVAAEYKHVLFVDGNHEHTKAKFDLDKSKLYNTKLFTMMPNVYLLDNFPFIYEGVAFVGANGWWDYRIGEPHVSRDATYNHYKNIWGEKSLQRTLVQGSEDYTYIMDHCSELNSMDTIKSIVVVTHTIPHSRGVDWQHGAENLGVGCFGNKKMEQN